MTALRSILFAPGNHARRVEKAFTLGADAVLLDLEDACPVSEKVETRAVVAAALRHPRNCFGYVRVNGLATEFAFGDIAALVQPGVDGIVLPKVSRSDDLCVADWVIGQFERERGLAHGAIDLIPIIETAAALTAIGAIARSGPRVKRLAFGAGDLTLDLGLSWTREEIELLPYRSAIVLASRTAGLQAPLDTVWADLNDLEGLRRSTQHARALGFQGKLCLHPDQVPVVNEIFTPNAAEVEQAKRIVESFAKAERQGSASLQIDGQFVDYAIARRAQHVLETAAYIAAQRRSEGAG